MLRDRIVCGINDDVIQKRLLAEPKLDYAKAVETALNMETAAQSVRDLKSKSDGYSNNTHVQGQVQVHKTSTNTTSGPNRAYLLPLRK